MFIIIVYNKLIKIVFLNYYKKKIEILCVNGLKHYYFLIFAGVIIDYKEQVFFIKIRANAQYFFCHMLLKQEKNLTKT